MSMDACFIRPTRSLFVSIVFGRLGRKMLWVVPILIFIGSTTASACQGEDFQRTQQYERYVLTVHYQCNQAGNYQNCVLQEFPNILAEGMKLPLSCQQLLQRMYPPPRPRSDGAMCSGQICCDGSGCYGG